MKISGAQGLWWRRGCCAAVQCPHLTGLAISNPAYCQVYCSCKFSGVVFKGLGMCDMVWIVWFVQQAMMLLSAASQSPARRAFPSQQPLAPAALPQWVPELPPLKPPESQIQSLSTPVPTSSCCRGVQLLTEMSKG